MDNNNIVYLINTKISDGYKTFLQKQYFGEKQPYSYYIYTYDSKCTKDNIVVDKLITLGENDFDDTLNLRLDIFLRLLKLHRKYTYLVFLDTDTTANLPAIHQYLSNQSQVIHYAGTSVSRIQSLNPLYGIRKQQHIGIQYVDSNNFILSNQFIRDILDVESDVRENNMLPNFLLGIFAHEKKYQIHRPDSDMFCMTDKEMRQYNPMRQKRDGNHQENQPLTTTLVPKKLHIVIPLTIYQTFSTKYLQNQMKQTVDNLRSANPEFKHVLMDDQDCSEYIRKNFSDSTYRAYLALNPGAYRADLWRYCILYNEGGIYLDIKYACYNQFKLIDLCYDEHFVQDYGEGGGIYNALMVCKPKNELLKKTIVQIIENVRTKFYGTSDLGITGPMLLKQQQCEVNVDLSHQINPRVIVFRNIVILKEYDEYRNELVQTYNIGYSKLWENRKVYNVNSIIPRTIYYLFDEPVEQLLENNKSICKNYTQKFFNKDMIDNYIQNKFPKQVYDFYSKLTHPEKKKEFAIYSILYLFGGFYLDSKMWLMNNLDLSMTENDNVVLFFSDQEEVSKHILGFTQRNKLLQALMKNQWNLTRNYPHRNELKYFGKLCVIPLKIFQTWYTKTNLSRQMQRRIDGLMEQNPEFEFHLYDDDDCYNFIKYYFDKSVLDAFVSLVPGAYKADLWRLCVLYVHGGIYLDIKLLGINGFKFINMVDQEHFVKDRKGNWIWNALIISKPKSPFVMKCIESIVVNVQCKYYGLTPLSPTGPALLGKISLEIPVNLDLTFDQSGLHVAYQNNQIISTLYDEYRKEKTPQKHYSVLWKERKIYK
jgi:mannosyltransferase OCH1-like enzyme